MASVNSFSDVIPIMDEAVMRADGIRYRCPTYGAAVSFRQRCYRYRAKMQKLAAERMGDVPGMEASTPYDELIIALEDAATRTPVRPRVPIANKNQPFDLVISTSRGPGVLLDSDGEPIEISAREIDSEELEFDFSLDLDEDE